MGLLTYLWGAVTHLAKRTTPENPTFNWNDPQAWDEFLGGTSDTDAGIKVSHASITGYPPVMQAVSLISGDIAKLPLELFRKVTSAEGVESREPARKHAAYKLVKHKPNEEVSAYKFWRRFVVHVLLWGNAYIWIERSESGKPLALYNLLPDRTAPERVMLAGGPKLVYVTEVETPKGRKPIVLDPRDVIHVEGVSIDNLQGIDQVARLRDAWSIGLAIQKFQASFFRQGARVGGVLEIPAHMKPAAKDTLEEGFTKRHVGPDNWFKVVILREGAKFHSTTMDLQGAQMSELGDAAVRNVARSFNLPPSKLGVPGSVSYGSATADNQAYLSQTLSTWLYAIATECNIKLLSDGEQRNERYCFEHNTRSLLRMDMLQRFQAYAIALRNGIWTDDEVRAMEGFNPLPEESKQAKQEPLDDPQKTGGDNDESQDNDGKQVEKEADKAGSAEESDDPPKRHAWNRWLFDVGSRARRKAKAGPNAFLEYVGSNLDTHRSQDGARNAVLDWFATQLTTIADTIPADELYDRVDDAARELETDFNRGSNNV